MLCFQEAQLNEVLSASNLDPSALTMVTRKLEVGTTHTVACFVSLYCLHYKWWKASRWLWLYTRHKLLPSTGCAWLQKQCNQRPPVWASQSVQGKGLGCCELLGMTYTYHTVTYLVILNQIVSRNFARQNLGWKVWVWGTILVYYLLVASFPGCSHL